MLKPTAKSQPRLARRYRSLVLVLVPAFMAISYYAIPATLWQVLEPQAAAATFTVTNTSDSGAGSLRDAIVNANSGGGTISFNIPPNDPRHFYYVNDGVPGAVSRSLIAVTSASDDTSIADIDPDWPHSWYSIETAGFIDGVQFASVTIDGFSQPGSVPNTNQNGALNSVLKIEVTNSATDHSCSRIFRGIFAELVIKGLVVNGCGVSSGARLIDLEAHSDSSVAAGNYLGTDPSGTIANGSGYGVHISESSGVRVGGTAPADRNLISGNFRGVDANNGGVSNSGFTLTVIEWNLIGTKRDGVSPLGNGLHPEQPTQKQDGVRIAAVNGYTHTNQVENNVIAFNARYGVDLTSGGVGTGANIYGNRIAGNSIHSNGNIGINLDGNDLGPVNAVTPNDPCDADEGFNGLQNYPVIKSAVISGGAVSISGTLNTDPGGTYRLEFFASTASDATYFGEGRTLLGTTTVVVPAGSCDGTFDLTLPLPAGSGNVITATATDADDNTSEFSAVYFAQSQSVSCALESDGLVSWYSAEGNVNDAEGENHGRFLISPPRYIAGKVGQAFDFGRNNADVINVPDTPDLDFTNAFTMEMWVAPRDPGLATGQTFFISKGDLAAVGTQSYGILFTPDRKIVNRVSNNSAIDQLVSTSSIPLNQFSHIAATYDGTNLRVYVNGLLDGSSTTAIGSLLNTGGPVVIGGGYFNNSPNAVIGAVDEPSLYDRALSDTEIAAIHGAGSAGKCGTLTSPPTPTPTATPSTTPTPAPGTVVINLDAVPDDPQDFSFDIAQSFSLDDDSDPTLPSSRQFEMAAGGHVFRMQGETGWLISQISCIDPDNGSGTVTGIEAGVDLDPGEIVTCTFTVTKQQGTVVINLDAVPNDPQDFTFDLPQAFSLDDDDDPTLPSSRQFVLPAGTRVFRLPGEAGWAISQISCIDPDNGTTTSLIAHDAVIDLDHGETVTCTFTVTKQQGTVVINLDAVPDDPQDFTFDIPQAFSLDDDADPTLPSSRQFELASGNRLFRLPTPAGWRVTGINCLDPDNGTTLGPGGNDVIVDLDAGETVTCTFTVTRQQGTVVIKLDAIPDSSRDVAFSLSGGLGASLFFWLDDDADDALPSSMTFGDLIAGSYAITQTVPVGFDLTGLSCSDPDSGSTTNLATATATIDLDAGEIVTCTFTDTARPLVVPGSVVIKLDAQPDGPQDFEFSSTGGPGLVILPFLLDDDVDDTLPSSVTFNNLAPGSYGFTQIVPAGWDLTGLSCADPDSGSTTNLATSTVTIDVDAGEVVTCTFTNRARPGMIRIVMDAVPDAKRDFLFTGSGGVPDFVLDDDDSFRNSSTTPSQRTFGNLPTGEYHVRENIPGGGFHLTGLTCDDPDGGSTVSIPDRRAIIDLDPGETVVCTFTNSQSRVIIVKDAVPDSSRDFSFTGSGDIPNFVLDDDSTLKNPSGLQNTREFAGIEPGEYDIRENLVGGWLLIGLVCADPDGGSTVSLLDRRAIIDLDPGETVLCMFTSTRSP